MKDRFKGTTKPPNWTKYIYELDPNNTDNNGLKNEDLIAWMKIPTTKNFRKLYRIVDHEKGGRKFADDLPQGSYSFLIEYNYPVIMFGGRKLLLIKSGGTAMLAEYNFIVGFMFLSTGVLVLFGSLVMFLVGKKYSKMRGILKKDPNPAELQAKNFNTIKNLLTNVNKN